ISDHYSTPNMQSLGKLISCIFALFSQFALALIPHYFPSFSLLTHLLLSALVLLVFSGVGKFFRRLLRLHASAPAFVFFNTLFIWGVHIAFIRKAISLLWNVVFNLECGLLLFGLHSIISADPGLVAYEDATSKELIRNEEAGVLRTGLCQLPDVKLQENSLPLRRIRYCKYCKVYIKGFDHHCPAFGNCIGQKNHLQFMVLLMGFVMVEASYIVCSTKFLTKLLIFDKAIMESNLSGSLAISTRLFSILQIIWQINWKSYPEFQKNVQNYPGQFNVEPRFKNPYDKGVLGNIKDFLSAKE
ncbi:hypothetical protein IFM89_036630, partial [Coptis chinensis]